MVAEIIERNRDGTAAVCRTRSSRSKFAVIVHAFRDPGERSRDHPLPRSEDEVERRVNEWPILDCQLDGTEMAVCDSILR